MNSGRAESVKGEIAVGNFSENLKTDGPDVAFPTVIASISRVVKYYYQAINDLPIDEGAVTEWGDKVMSSFIDKTAPPSAL